MALTVEGLTHASSVIPVDSCSEAALGIVTSAFVPLNCNAPPYLPDVTRVAFVIVPVWPLPDASVTVVPEPSLNPYAATRPFGPAGVVALATFELLLTLPAASVAR